MHIIIFIVTVSYAIYKRRYVLSDAELVSTSERAYGMIAFATIPFFLALGAMYAAIESRKLKVEDPWDSVDTDLLKQKI